VFTLAAAAIEQKDSVFVTHHRRPKRASDVRTSSDASLDARVGIVLQGPIVVADDFTVETVRIYRRLFPDADVIVSTWDTEATDVIRRLEQTGVTLIKSTPPVNPGPANINYQLTSSSAGVRAAHRRGCEYVLKTRTDQRMYAPSALAFLLAACRRFPVTTPYSQRARLVGCSLNTFKYRMYDVSDMLLFGDTEDMMRYWNAPLDSRGPDSVPAGDSLRDFSRWNVCEVYLVTQFLERIGRPLAWTLEDSYRVFAEHFCIVDRESIDLFWIKYGRRAEYRGMRYDGEFTNRVLTFRDWLLLYSQSISATDHEHALDLAFGTEVPARA
jgi:hypothetical protein